jgi:uncharacterized cupredoxin-like copper-binding protein
VRIRFPVTAALAAGLLLAGCTGSDPDPSDDRAAGVSSAEDTGEETSTEDTADDPAADGDEAPMGDDGMDHGDGEAMGEPADASEATRTISVEAFDMAFDPATISVEPGEVVTFEVTNTGEAVHEFFLGDSAMQQEHAQEMEEMGNDMAHDEPYSIRLDPGETKQLTWRFAESGDVEFACHEPGHYQAGMHGQITVG